MAATVVTMGLIHLATFTFSLAGLAALGTVLLRAVQAMLAAAVLTPLTIVLLALRNSDA